MLRIPDRLRPVLAWRVPPCGACESVGAATHFEVGANNWSPSRLMNDFKTTLEPSNDG